MAKHVFTRPRTRPELDASEAAGFWRAIKLARKIGEGSNKITLQTILDIHKALMQPAFPEIAGRFRKDGEDVKKLKCVEPPPGRLVNQRIYEFWIQLDRKLATLPRKPVSRSKRRMRTWYDAVIDTAAWVQHGISAILYRYGLPPSRVKYEGDAREEYLNAMCQIDGYSDYEPLKKLIARSVDEAFREEMKLRRRPR